MKILFAVPYVPNLIRVRPYNLIRQLAARGHQVTVMTVWTNEQERAALQEISAYCSRVEAVHMPGWRSLWNCAWALPSVKPLQTVYSWQPGFAESAFAELVKENGKSGYDVVHVEHLRGAQYGLYIKDRMDKAGMAIPIVWDSVDSISHLFRQAMVRSKSALSRGITRFELKRTEPYEAWLTTQFDHTLVTSNLDRETMVSLRSLPAAPSLAAGANNQAVGPTSKTADTASERISVLRNGVDLDYFRPSASEGREPATVIASGKMSYHANVNMAVRLVETIMPAVWARQPEVKVVIVGKDPPKSIQALSKDARVTVTGTVKDVRPYLQAATIAAAPVEYGAGIQNKVLEAMACGTPVVATPQAVSAIDLEHGGDALIAADSQAFADGILWLLADRKRQIKLGENGRHYVERNHQWSKIAEQLEGIYFKEIDLKQR
jgi:glycosyltransferase involved in cell wall biosynthesis